MYSLHYKGTQDLSTYIPSADVLAKIDSAGFVPEAFVSQSSNIVSLDDESLVVEALCSATPGLVISLCYVHKCVVL